MIVEVQSKCNSELIHEASEKVSSPMYMFHCPILLFPPKQSHDFIVLKRAYQSMLIFLLTHGSIISDNKASMILKWKENENINMSNRREMMK